MGNCLVTKLKGEVNNPALPKLGELVIQVKDPSKFMFYVNSGFGIRAESAVLQKYDANGSKVGTPSISLDECGAYGFGVTDGYTGKVFLNNNYLGEYFKVREGELDASYLKDLAQIICSDTIGGSLVKGMPDSTYSIGCELRVIEYNLGGIGEVEMTFLDNYYPTVKRLVFQIGGTVYSCYIDVAKIIKNFPTLVEVEYGGRATLQNMSPLGIADFGKLPELTKVSHNLKYSWRLEDFVANKRSVGVTSGSANVFYGGDDSGGGVCSFNGQKISSDVTLFTWTATTITYNGVTINA